MSSLYTSQNIYTINGVISLIFAVPQTASSDGLLTIQSIPVLFINFYIFALRFFTRLALLPARASHGSQAL
jgi:hypothetical protein